MARRCRSCARTYGSSRNERPTKGWPLSDTRLDRYAELIVHVGANVQPGQIVDVAAPDETLSHTPKWLVSRARALGDVRSAAFGITGDPEPELLADLDGERVGKARMVELANEGMRIVNEMLCNWCVVAYPNEGWARTMF